MIAHFHIETNIEDCAHDGDRRHSFDVDICKVCFAIVECIHPDIYDLPDPLPHQAHAAQQDEKRETTT